MNHPKLTNAPAAIVELADVKKQLRAPFSDDDAYITSLITAAQYHVEGWQGWLGRCFMSQTWTQKFDEFQYIIQAPFPDLISAVVKYFDVNGDEQTIDAANYHVLDHEICFKPIYSFPTLEDDRPNAISIAWTHGVSTVPPDVKLAVKMLVAHWYENREAVVPNERRVEYDQVPLAFKSILDRYHTRYNY